MNRNHYTLLAELFEYPTSEYNGELAEVQAYLDEHYPEAAKVLQPFTDCLTNLDLNAREELYCRSFDVQAVTTLDLGYVLFGDDYKRGAMLVNMNGELRDAEIDPGTELSDHLQNVLKLVAKIKKEDVLHELMEIIIQPGLRKILMDFNPDMVDRKTKVYFRHHRTIIDRPEEYGLIYELPIQALLMIMESDFDVKRIDPAERTSDFLKNITKEVELEPIITE